MKLRLLLFTLFLSITNIAFAQSGLEPRIGYGRAQAGNGDIPGHWFMAGVQKQFSKRSGFSILGTGTYMERTREWGQGHETFEKSNGVALEGTYNIYLNLGRVQLYPSIGPVVRYASERNIYQLSIYYDNQGAITEFVQEMHTRNHVQPGYVLALNLDVTTTQTLKLGIRGAVQSFLDGQRLASVGVTLQNLKWGF